MLEVCPGLLLGSMGDAEAVFARVPSVVARHHVTHVLSLCNERPEWMEEPETETEREMGEKKMAEESEKEEEVKESEAMEEKEGGEERKGRKRRGRGTTELPRRKMFVEVVDMPESDLLHQFESCCQFIREGRETGTVLVHW